MLKKTVYGLFASFWFMVIGVFVSGLLSDSNRAAIRNLVPRLTARAVSAVSVAETLPISEFNDKGYIIGFELPSDAYGSQNCYVPKYTITDPDTAVLYAELFGLPKEYSETTDSYVFSDHTGTLFADKYAPVLRYEIAHRGTEHAEMTDFDAIQAATDFIDSKMLVLFYDEVRVHFDGQQYRVDFINRLGNLRNFAFNNRVIIDKSGHVCSLEYYLIQYERISACRVMSAAKAASFLPKTDMTVLLSDCRLVYIYENSILQPAYLFEGSASGGKSFECFIKAGEF